MADTENTSADNSAEEVHQAAVAAIAAHNPVHLDIVTAGFIAANPDLTVENASPLADIFAEEHPECFVKDEPGENPVEHEQAAAIGARVRELIAEANPVDIDVVTSACLTAGEINKENVDDVVKAFVAAKPSLFVQQKRAPKEADRYIVETTTVFELLGSTVTYREGRIVNVDSRDYDIAREHDVPLRPLAAIKR